MLVFLAIAAANPLVLPADQLPDTVQRLQPSHVFASHADQPLVRAWLHELPNAPRVSRAPRAEQATTCTIRVESLEQTLVRITPSSACMVASTSTTESAQQPPGPLTVSWSTPGLIDTDWGLFGADSEDIQQRVVLALAERGVAVAAQSDLLLTADVVAVDSTSSWPIEHRVELRWHLRRAEEGTLALAGTTTGLAIGMPGSADSDMRLQALDDATTRWLHDPALVAATHGAPGTRMLSAAQPAGLHIDHDRIDQVMKRVRTARTLGNVERAGGLAASLVGAALLASANQSVRAPSRTAKSLSQARIAEVSGWLTLGAGIGLVIDGSHRTRNPQRSP